jgi:hypothetical protein
MTNLELKADAAKFRKLSLQAADNGEKEASDAYWRIAETILRHAQGDDE